MSEVTSYLTEKANAGEREWLRREPRYTHPEILALAREFEETGDPGHRALGFVEARVGGLDESLRQQLGHEVYVARGLLEDEKARARTEKLAESGYVRLDQENIEIKDGGRYLIRTGVTYVGREEPSFGAEQEVRAKYEGTRYVFLPKGARTRYFVPSGPALVKEIVATQGP